MMRHEDKEILIRYRMDQARSALKEALFLKENSDMMNTPCVTPTNCSWPFEFHRKGAQPIW